MAQSPPSAVEDPRELEDARELDHRELDHRDSAAKRAAVLASLPDSVQPAVESGTFVAVDGGVGWGDRIGEALDTGARGILVYEPCDVAEFDLAQLSEVSARAAADCIPVVLDTGWAQNCAVASAADGFRELSEQHRILEASVVARPDASPRTLLVAQLALVRAAVSAVSTLEPIIVNSHGYSMVGNLNSGTQVSLAATLTRALPESATLRMLGQHGSVTLRLTEQTTARPGRVTLTGPSGSTQLPTRFETGHRVAWRRLSTAVSVDQSVSDLADFIDDMTVAAGAITADAATPI
jgi:hypothetical protein